MDLKKINNLVCVMVALAMFVTLTTARTVDVINVSKRENVCYGVLGCFSSYSDIPVPQSPDHIATKFVLHRRGSNGVFTLNSVNYEAEMGGWMRHLDSGKQTKIIIHGYIDNGSKAWIGQMVTELLKKGDFNVIVTDWGHGSLAIYQQAAANTFVVGAELAFLLKYLHDNNGLQYSDVHIIGHSLGAQTAGHVGHRVPGIGRITGLDPADPGFTGMSVDKRLDASDAAFVDVIHTDASKFNLVAGYGTHDAVGTIDFYPNSGEHQPGCPETLVGGALGSITSGHITEIGHTVTCSHSRSRDLFTESINSACKFYGHLCPSGDSFEAGRCLGCPSGGCPVMGYNADQFKSSHGTFYLSTSGAAPFCGHEYFVDVKVSDATYHTYGEFIITLVGTNGKSEPLKFESLMHSIDHGLDEKHVISTHNDIGTVTAVQLEFVKAHNLHGILAANYVSVYSVTVEPAETAQKMLFCAHNYHFRSGQTHTVSDHTGCH